MKAPSCFNVTTFREEMPSICARSSSRLCENSGMRIVFWTFSANPEIRLYSSKTGPIMANDSRTFPLTKARSSA